MHVVLTLLLGIRTPGTATQPAEVAPATSLERIRQGLEQPPAAIMIQSADPNLPPIFRLEIRDRPLPYDHLWERDWVPSYVRPSHVGRERALSPRVPRPGHAGLLPRHVRVSVLPGPAGPQLPSRQTREDLARRRVESEARGQEGTQGIPGSARARRQIVEHERAEGANPDRHRLVISIERRRVVAARRLAFRHHAELVVEARHEVAEKREILRAGLGRSPPRRSPCRRCVAAWGPCGQSAAGRSSSTDGIGRRRARRSRAPPSSCRRRCRACALRACPGRPDRTCGWCLRGHLGRDDVVAVAAADDADGDDVGRERRQDSRAQRLQR